MALMEGSGEETGGRYRVDEKIGEGGIGTVYSGWDTQLKRRVAIKRLRNAEGAAKEAVLREATALATLQHPNVVTIYDIASDDIGPFAVMEFVDGENLDDVVARGVFPEEDFVKFVRQALDGLDSAHRERLLHRDIKPGNLMLKWLPDGNFRVKILDFGLAKLLHAPSIQSVDQHESLYGSIHTMAPEQFKREPLDSRTDLYSLGCIFYFTLTGHPPFAGETLPQVMAAHLEHQVIPLHQYRPDLPPALADWVMKLINREPADRPNSAKESLTALEEIVAPKPVRTPDSQGPLHMEAREHPVLEQKPQRKLNPAALAVVIVLLCGIGVAVWILSSESKSTPKINPALVANSATPVPKIDPAEKPKFAPPVEARSMIEPGLTEVFSATNLEVLRPNLGKHVIVQGKIFEKSQTKTGSIRFLNFDSNYRNAVSLAFFGRPEDPEITDVDLDRYVGKMVRADGILSEHKGALQIDIRSPAQITTFE